MGFLKRSLETRAAGNTLSRPGEPLMNAFNGGNPTYSGKTVTPFTADRLTTVYSAVRAYTDAIASASLHVYRETAEGKVPATGTREWDILADEANVEMTSIDLFEIVMQQLQLFGNAFIWKERDEEGFVSGLWPTHPGSFQVGRAPNAQGVYTKYYRYTPPYGETAQFLGTDRDFLHIKASSINGLLGLSPVAQAAEKLGVIAAQEEFVGRFYKNSATPSGVLVSTGPQALTEEAMKRIRADWIKTQSGVGNAGNVVVLENGLKYEPLTMPMADQEFVEQVQAGIVDIANIFRLPVWKLNSGPSGGRSITYATSESQNLAFWTDSLTPWLAKIERALHRDPDIILDNTIHCEFDVSNLLRADHKTRAEINVMYLNAGAYTPDEVRLDENKAPLPDGEGTHAKALPAAEQLKAAVTQPVADPEKDDEPEGK